jgi:hypothetical protein
MVTHKCNKETDITTLSIQSKNMAEKIDKIEKSVDTIRTDLQKVKDIIGTMEFAAERNNSDIKQLISSSFSELKLNFEIERETAIKGVKKRTKDNYANKLVEKTVYAFI